MGIVKIENEVVCFFCAVTYAKETNFEKALKQLNRTWGAVHRVGSKYNFSEVTNYYFREMGGPLYKRIVFFEKLLPVENLHQTKLLSNQMETAFKKKGLRQVNLDPGYLTEAKVILFSTKDFYHRIYIGNGIFGEVTLTFKAKTGFEALPWTFPDYREPQMLEFMNEVREWYRVLLGRKRKKTNYKLKHNTENL